MTLTLPHRIRRAQSILWNLLLLTIGGFLIALGTQCIAAQHELLTGGVLGTALLTWYATHMADPATWYLLFNIPLFMFSWFLVGKRFFFYSLYGTLVVAFFAKILSVDIVIQNDLYAAVAAGVLCGAGIGMMLRTEGSSGGLDLVGVYLNRRWNIGIGTFSFAYNALLFLASFAVIDLDRIIVSIIQVFISSAALDYVLRLFSQRKMVLIVSERGEEICEAITVQEGVGATLMRGKGGYSGNDREIVMTVTNNVMIKRLENLVLQIDEHALMIVENTFYVMGAHLPQRSL